MSDSARHKLFAIAEATYGTTPATPTFDTIRHTGTTLGLTKGAMVSEELRSDRQITDMRHGTRQSGGDVSCEMSYGSFDAYLQAVLLGVWAVKAAAYTAGTISAAASDNSINDSAGGLPVLDPGDKVTLAGFTGETGNNQTGLVVVSSTANKMVLSGGDALVDDAAGESVTVTTLTQTLKAGTTRRSFSFLRQFEDRDSADLPFELHTGVELNTFNLTVGVEAIIAAVFGTVGRAMTQAQTAPSGSTYNDPTATEVMDSFSGTMYEGGTAIATVTEVNFTLENGIAPRFTIGSDTTQLRPSIGRSNLTGQVTVYAENGAALNKFINQTESSISFMLSDSAGNAYRIRLPRIKYTGGDQPTQGQGPVMTTLPFQALMQSALGSQIAIDRIAA